MVTTKGHRPKFAMTLPDGMRKIVERGGILSLWKGNGTSVLHRFPFSAINFFVYENMLDIMTGLQRPTEKGMLKLIRRPTYRLINEDDMEEVVLTGEELRAPSKFSRFVAGATAGSTACIACYPLDLVRTRLTTELPGKEHYKGIADAFVKITKEEGFIGLYSGILPTLSVAVPNFAISYTVYGTLKEYALDDELFYNLRAVNEGNGEAKIGFSLTLMCGAASGTLATLATFPMDTIRRRMQIQNLHVPPDRRLTAIADIKNIVSQHGFRGLYRGLTPEILKVVPMVGTMFVVYELLKEKLNVN
eukprot:scaffold545041_cov51-Attheya_sp.AAC.1